MAIGDIVANLSVNSAPWNRGLKSAQVSAQSFSASATTAFSGLSGKLIASVGAAVSVGAAYYTLASSIGRTAGIADQAAQTGLSGAFLQKLGYAADQSGVSAETLTKSVAKMTLTIADAKGGSETAAKSLGKIGVSVSDLESLSPEQQLAKIADGLGAIPDVGQRAAAAVDIFGKAGAELGPLFAGGSAALTGLMDQASGLGIGLSDEDIAKASAADDAMQRMKSTVTALIDRVSTGLAPAFTMVADTVTFLVPVFGALVDSVMGSFSAIGSMIGATFDGVVSTIVTAMSVAEFTFTNFGAVVDLAMIESHIAVLAFVEGVDHFFTTSMPAYLDWFGSNWQSVFMTAFDFAATVFINIGQNIRNAWTAIIDFISGNSEGLAFVWTPLAEGFVSTVKELPDIPERAITGLESQLRAESKVMGDALGSGLSDTISKNLDKVDKIKSTLAATGDSAKPGPDTDLQGGSGIKGKSGTFAGALEQGSQAAYSAVVQAMGAGSSDKIAKDSLAVQKEQLKLMKKSGIAQGTPNITVVERLA